MGDGDHAFEPVQLWVNKGFHCAWCILIVFVKFSIFWKPIVLRKTEPFKCDWSVAFVLKIAASAKG